MRIAQSQRLSRDATDSLLSSHPHFHWYSTFNVRLLNQSTFNAINFHISSGIFQHDYLLSRLNFILKTDMRVNVQEPRTRANNVCCNQMLLGSLWNKQTSTSFQFVRINKDAITHWC